MRLFVDLSKKIQDIPQKYPGSNDILNRPRTQDDDLQVLVRLPDRINEFASGNHPLVSSYIIDYDNSAAGEAGTSDNEYESCSESDQVNNEVSVIDNGFSIFPNENLTKGASGLVIST